MEDAEVLSSNLYTKIRYDTVTNLFAASRSFTVNVFARALCVAHLHVKGACTQPQQNLRVTGAPSVVASTVHDRSLVRLAVSMATRLEQFHATC